MTVLPVIERELRVQARLGFTYMLRVLGAVALMCACVWFAGWYGLTPGRGRQLFGWLNCTMVVSLWILVPLICADCISRERREGTLGLLFLTPLKAREIVLAKGLVHGMRAFTLLLAALPVMTISFLLGGISWREAALCGLVNFSSICWALAAGLLASSLSKSWMRSLLLSGGLAGCFGVGLMLLTGFSLILALQGDAGFRLPFPYSYWNWKNALQYNVPQVALPVGFFAMSDFDGWWGLMFGSMTGKSARVWLLVEAGLTLFSLLVLLAAIWAAAWNMRRTWQEEPPSARRVWLEQKLVSPIIAVGFFHRWLRRKLERNPIGWLEQRTWSGRLMTWGWLAVMISFYSAALSSPNASQLLEAVQNLLAWMLVGIMAASSAGSFQRERETRVLELLLVSPMSAGQIISGRLRGLWGQFAPSLALLLAVWLYLGGAIWERSDLKLVPFFCGAFVTLPVIGLYESLHCKHYVSSFIWTLMTGVAGPFIFKALAVDTVSSFFAAYNYFVKSSPWSQSLVFPFTLMERPWFIIVIQAALTFLIGWRLHRDLTHRTFAFSKGAE